MAELSQDRASALAWRNLGVLEGSLGRWRESAKLLRQAARRAPEDVTILSDLGKALLHAGRARASIEVLERALEISPDDPEIRVRLAKSLASVGELARVLAECERCPDYVPALRLKGQQLAVASRNHDALAPWRKVRSSGEASRNDLATLATVEWRCGNTATSLELARELMDSGPVHPVFRSMYVGARLHSPEETIEGARGAVEEWRSSVARESPANGARSQRLRSRGRRRLRIGYVTNEFHDGPAIHFILPLLTERDRGQFEITGYHCGPQRDRWTRRAAREFDRWREAFSEEDLVRDIRRDQVDILVDLSGHYGSRLTVFQERHAPVQMSFPNYPGSTGARQMDYILTDEWVCPRGNESQYTERPLRLKQGYLPYRPPASPALAPPPAEAAGHITFGLFQRPSKMNAAVWDAIAETMRQTPRSLLLMHHAAADLDERDSLACQHFAGELEARGVSRRRISFRGPLTLKEHLGLLAKVDIAFDTFPYNGQTTTCECLWMGVPVVSLRQELHAARVGWQILDRTGCGELVADTVEGYVRTGVDLARDSTRLSRYRSGLRSAMRRSALMNGSVVRGIEAAYEGVLRDA